MNNLDEVLQKIAQLNAAEVRQVLLYIVQSRLKFSDSALARLPERTVGVA